MCQRRVRLLEVAGLNLRVGPAEPCRRVVGRQQTRHEGFHGAAAGLGRHAQGHVREQRVHLGIEGVALHALRQPKGGRGRVARFQGPPSGRALGARAPASCAPRLRQFDEQRRAVPGSCAQPGVPIAESDGLGLRAQGQTDGVAGDLDPLREELARGQRHGPLEVARLLDQGIVPYAEHEHRPAAHLVE